MNNFQRKYLTMMLVKEGLFCVILLTWILQIQGRPQGESMVKVSEKPEPVSTKSISFLNFNSINQYFMFKIILTNNKVNKNNFIIHMKRIFK